MLSLHNVTYLHPDKDVLFESLNLNINKNNKIALVGNNGSGKSTMLKLIAGVLQPYAGSITMDASRNYVPQHFGQYNNYTIAQALGVEHKLKALSAILSGDVSEANMTALDDDWTIEERCNEALATWGLHDLYLHQKLNSLSGGQKTKVLLAGINVHKPDLVLLDEPSNHLDVDARKLLYDYIRTTQDTLIVVSHDRTLLNLLPQVLELSKKGITAYGGNYDFYKEQKSLEAAAFAEDLRDKEKTLRKAKEVARETAERQQKLDARGRKKQEKSGVPTIMLNTLRNNAENSTAKAKDAHAEKVAGISEQVYKLRKELPDKDKMKIGFDSSELHKGKVLLKAQEINYSYGTEPIWPQPLSFEIKSGDRLAMKGANGSGKTTLIKIILGHLQPIEGSIERAVNNAIYIDQDYSILNDAHTVYQQAQHFNTGALQEHEVKSKLTHFLFTKEDWDKPCSALSGGEKMRLLLCCLTISTEAPDLIILDEPTNNLDIQNIEILTDAINEYKGTLIVVSHDNSFLEEVGIEKILELEAVGR